MPEGEKMPIESKEEFKKQSDILDRWKKTYLYAGIILLNKCIGSFYE